MHTRENQTIICLRCPLEELRGLLVHRLESNMLFAIQAGRSSCAMLKVHAPRRAGTHIQEYTACQGMEPWWLMCIVILTKLLSVSRVLALLSVDSSALIINQTHASFPQMTAR